MMSRKPKNSVAITAPSVAETIGESVVAGADTVSANGEVTSVEPAKKRKRSGRDPSKGYVVYGRHDRAGSPVVVCQPPTIGQGKKMIDKLVSSDMSPFRLYNLERRQTVYERAK